MDVFDLVAKIRLDDSEYRDGVGKAKGSFSTLASGVKTGLATVAKVGAAAVSAGVAGVAALTKMGIEGYAQYEQLTGGVETLFKTSSGAVMKYAENAYKTAGMSANQYMETVTSFSASLIQSLDGDTAKAAEVGNMAITDMSDNANKMGTSIEMIQNAYQGFAKQNYTMLDNLKLGYGGTKEEMERLIADANKVKEANGEMADLSIDSFADVTEAIHIMQTEMGITGTTAAEAATTIEGSISMMKAAWSNLVVGMADENANMEVLINNFVESTATAAQNLLPRIEQTLIGIGQLITALAPVVAEALPVLIENVLPSLLTAGVSLVTAIVNGVVTALPALYTALLEGVQIILVEVFGVSEAKAGEFADSVNSFFAKIGEGFRALVESAQTDGTWLNEIWTGLKGTGQAFGDFLGAVWDTLSAVFSWCVESINTEGTYLNTIWQNIQTFIAAAVSVIQDCITLFTSILRGDWSSAWAAVKSIAATVWDAISSIVSNGINYVKSFISNGLTAAKSVVSNILSSISGYFSNVWNNVKSSVSNAISAVKSSISSGLNSAKSTASGILDSISSKFSSIWNTCKSVVTTAIDAVKGALNFSWELPKLKMPHFSISGEFSLNPPSVPSFGISWYRKAYDNAMVLSNPTIFGYSGGKFLGGGDGNGNEIVAGESHLMGLIGHVVESKTAEQNEKVIALLSALLEAMVGGNEEMIRALLSDRIFAVGEREFARLVKQYA